MWTALVQQGMLFTLNDAKAFWRNIINLLNMLDEIMEELAAARQRVLVQLLEQKKVLEETLQMQVKVKEHQEAELEQNAKRIQENDKRIQELKAKKEQLMKQLLEQELRGKKAQTE
jgi:hypothetical protein